MRVKCLLTLPFLFFAIGCASTSATSSTDQAQTDVTVPANETQVEQQPSIEPEVSFATLENTLEEFEFQSDLDVRKYSVLTDLPESGSAAFSGGVSILSRNDLGPQSFIGRISAEVDFAEDLVLGQADNFYRNDATDPMMGTLDLDLRLDRGVNTAVSYSMRGILDGTLQDGDAGETDFRLDVRADLFRDDYAALAGKLTGRVTHGDGGVDRDTGGFILMTKDAPIVP